MKKPMSNKSPEMRKAIEELFPGTERAIRGKKCPLCHKPIGKFRDKLSEHEYEISGMCQRCQDSAFEKSDYDS